MHKRPPHAPPPSAEAALALQQAGQTGAAERVWRQRLAADEGDTQALNNLANLLKESNRTGEAEAVYRQAIAARPDNFEALNNLGNLLKGDNRPEEAEVCLRQALALRPAHPDIRNNLGVLLHEQGQYAAAEVHFRCILFDQPTHLQSLNNLGNLLKDLRRFDEAEACYRRLLERYTDHPEARWNLGLLRLLRGDAEAGWPLYEARYHPGRQRREVQLPRLSTPAWEGETLVSRHILVWHEQGHGDEIQFARYLPLLKSQFGAARVTVICKPALQALLSTVGGVDAVLPAGAFVPAHDCWVLCGSLPLRFSSTRNALPAKLPYVGVPEAWRARWLARLPERRHLRVGLAWAGSRLHKNDRHRSLPSPTLLAPLWQVPGIDFFSLQTDRRGPLPAEQPMLDCGPNLTDFADSAALLSEMDLLITVDTALAHLAGALDRPCWVMLPWIGIDWRWGEHADDSPWYPGVLRLFRQSAAGDWTGLIKTVAEALRDWAGQTDRRQRRLASLPHADRQRIERTVDRLLAARHRRIGQTLPSLDK